ncbi:hypothetical protein YC2023_046473 [Brassica napus]
MVSREGCHSLKQSIAHYSAHHPKPHLLSIDESDSSFQRIPSSSLQSRLQQIPYSSINVPLYSLLDANVAFLKQTFLTPSRQAQMAIKNVIGTHFPSLIRLKVLAEFIILFSQPRNHGKLKLGSHEMRLKPVHVYRLPSAGVWSIGQLQWYICILHGWFKYLGYLLLSPSFLSQLQMTTNMVMVMW